MTIQGAVNSLYQIAVTEGKATSTKRLDSLAQFCIAELAKRGLEGAVAEAKLPGGGREKSWDVAWTLTAGFMAPRGGSCSSVASRGSRIDSRHLGASG